MHHPVLVSWLYQKYKKYVWSETVTLLQSSHLETSRYILKNDFGIIIWTPHITTNTDLRTMIDTSNES